MSGVLVAKQEHLSKLYWPFLERNCNICREQIEYELSHDTPESRKSHSDGDHSSSGGSSNELVSNKTPVAKSELKCAECDHNDNLWLCLICGYCGCGRYYQRHSLQHYDNTGHNFCMELNSQRIWNYRGDLYVHRLIKTRIQKNLNISNQNIENQFQLFNAFVTNDIKAQTRLNDPNNTEIEESKELPMSKHSSTSSNNRLDKSKSVVMSLPDSSQQTD